MLNLTLNPASAVHADIGFPGTRMAVSPGRAKHRTGDRPGHSNDSAMATTALAKHGRADRSTWSSTRARTLRR